MTYPSTRDTGVLMAPIEEFKQHRLPRLEQIRTHVHNGRPLSDADLHVMRKVLKDAGRTMPSTIGHPDLQEFCTYVIHLYNGITQRCLANEQAE